jgi:hypothetical protein
LAIFKSFQVRDTSFVKLLALQNRISKEIDGNRTFLYTRHFSSNEKFFLLVQLCTISGAKLANKYHSYQHLEEDQDSQQGERHPAHESQQMPGCNWA